ncbi:MAG: hypothetical protein J6D16_06415 [Clostridia bacterium]|nr:hypothetical protein [Clostridia bacterium]
MLRKISASLLFAGLLLWALTVQTHVPLLTLAAILIHEAGHLLAAHLMHMKPSGVSADTVGIRLLFRGVPPSYGKEILLCAAGPAANVFSLLIALPLCQENGGFFLSVSAALAILNLLPIEGFDGGRILHSTLCLWLAPDTADRISQVFSFLFLFVLWCVSVYLLMRTGSELSLFLFSAALFFRIFLQKKAP